MKKTISMYWPLAFVVPLVAAAVLQLMGNASSHNMQSPLGAEEVTAELARAVSYGMVGDSAALSQKPVHAAPAIPLAQAS